MRIDLVEERLFHFVDSHLQTNTGDVQHPNPPTINRKKSVCGDFDTNIVETVTQTDVLLS